MIEKIVKAISQTIKPDISTSGIATAVIGAIGIGLITTGTRKMTESITASALKSELDKEPIIWFSSTMNTKTRYSSENSKFHKPYKS